MIDTPEWVKYRYLDASVLVKLYVDEPHSETVRQFVSQHPKPFQTTALCLAEAMNVLKAKWLKKQLPVDDYLRAVRRLTVDAWGKVIEIQDYGLLNPSIHNGLARLVQRYNVDASDALQLLTIKNGVHSRMVGESASVLVTADKGLADAASAEGVRAWNCVDGPAPEWA